MRRHLLLLLAAFLLSLPLQAQLVPAGPEIRVDTGAGRNPIHVDVSMAPDGSYFAVWAYYHDYSSWSCDPGAIWGRHFDREGRPVTPPFAVVRLAGSCVEDLRLGPLVKGRRLLVWRNAYGKYHTADWLVAAIDSSGRAKHLKRRFSTQTTAGVIPLRSGNLLAVYNTRWSRDTDVRGQRFDATGRPLGQPFLIARDRGEIFGVDAVETQGTDLAVTWISYDESHPERSVVLLLARTMHADGRSRQGVFQVSGATEYELSRPRMSEAPEGGFAITWSSGTIEDTEAGEPGIAVRSRLYQADGTPSSPMLNLTPAHSGYHILEDAALGKGEILAVWSVPRQGENAAADDIGVSLMEAGGQQVDIEEPLSEETEGLQRRSAVSTDGKGLWLVAWAGDGPEGRGIYMRLFTSQP
jgi:hypothetical protein